MTLQRDSFFSRGHVPQFHFDVEFVRRHVSGDRSQGLAVRRKRYLVEVRLALQRVQFLAGGDVPQFGLARTRPGQDLAVRREGHVMRVTARRFEDAPCLFLGRRLLLLGFLLWVHNARVWFELWLLRLGPAKEPGAKPE